MSDVFISYSRIDSDFVHDLQESLIERGRDAWIDWSNIPPTAEWLQEIYVGIEAANAIIFVLSPEFLASETCGLEVAHAIAYKKRLVPIVRRDVDITQVNTTLRAINWIFFRKQDNFEQSFATLLAALDTDLAYDKASTRLLVRAREWETRNRSSAAMLRGIELDEAERWLAQGANKTPSPTKLQVEYVTSSRKDAGRRQRRLLTGVSVALVVTLILSVVSFALFRVAQAREQVAQENYAHALARQLAAQSLNHVSDQHDVSLLLAAEAYHRDPGSTEAADALLTSIESQPQLAGYFQDYSHKWMTVAFTPDGKMLAAVSNDGKIVFWDVATRHMIGSPIVTSQDNQYPVSISISPDGKLLAFTGSKATLNVWDIHMHRLMATSPSLGENGAEISSIAFGPDGKRLGINACTSTGGPFIGVWDLLPDKAPTLFPVPGNTVCGDGVAFSPNGSLLAADVFADTFIWNASTGDLVKGPLSTARIYPDDPSLGSIPAVGAAHMEAFSPDGSLLAVGECGEPTDRAHSFTFCLEGAVQLWSVATGHLVATLYGHNTDVTGIAFTPDGKVLASAAGDNSIILWDVRTHAQISQFDAHNAISNDLIRQEIAFSPRGDQLVSASASDLNISQWNVTSKQPIATSFTVLPDANDIVGPLVTAIAVSKDSRQLATASCRFSESGKVGFWNLATHKQDGEVAFVPTLCPYGMAFSPNGQTLAISDDTYVRLISATTHKFITPPWRVEDYVSSALAFSPSGTLLVAGGCDEYETKGEIWLWDVQTGRANKLAWKDHAGCVQSLAFSPDGTKLAAGLCLDKGTYPCVGPEVQIWDMENLRPIGQPIKTDFGDLRDIWFSPDGKSVAAHATTSYSTGGAAIWDVASHRQLQTFPADYGMAISNDWSLMVAERCVSPGGAGCSKSVTQLFSLKEGHKIGPPLDGTGYFLLTQDGKTMISLAPKGEVMLWDINPASWVSQICQMVGRNLTHDEWNRYLTNQESYRPTCPNMPLPPTV